MQRVERRNKEGTKMNLEEIAESLITEVEGIPSQHNIDGVVKIFESIQTGVNLNWENHIHTLGNDLLFYMRTCCPYCGIELQIEQNKDSVKVSEV